jgi:hypothetical protein
MTRHTIHPGDPMLTLKDGIPIESAWRKYLESAIRHAKSGKHHIAHQRMRQAEWLAKNH